MNDPRSQVVLQDEYSDRIKPLLEARRKRLKRAHKNVALVFLDAYQERLEVLYRAAQTGADNRLLDEIDELSPIVNPELGCSADLAHKGLGLGETRVGAGYSYAQTYTLLEKGRKAPKGARIKQTALDALQMSLEGKTHSEIADALCDRSQSPHNRQDDPLELHAHGDVCSERFRKQIAKIRLLYDKYKPLRK